jgi:predicted DNA-binding transcriptional regulator AlpA
MIWVFYFIKVEVNIMKNGEERMRFLNEREVSLLTGIALSTLRNNRHVGKGIPYSKISKSVRYALKDILDYMQAHRIDTSAIYPDLTHENKAKDASRSVASYKG